MANSKIDYIKRIQSTLKTKKLQISRCQIRKYMVDQNIDINSPNDEQLAHVKAYFLNPSIVIADDEVSMITEENSVTKNFEQPADNTQPESLDSPEKLSSPVLSNPESIESEEIEEPQLANLVTTEKEQLVSLKAQSLGIQLTENQVALIADSLDASNLSFTDTVAEIENALIAYIELQHHQESQTVSGMVERVTNRIQIKNQSINEQIDSGVIEIKTALEVANQHQKSHKGKILNRLRLLA